MVHRRIIDYLTESSKGSVIFKKEKEKYLQNVKLITKCSVFLFLLLYTATSPMIMVKECQVLNFKFAFLVHPQCFLILF